jgi:membrane associated rhomboid family serine protease
MAFLQAPRPRREPALRAPASVLVLIALLIGAHAARVYAPGHLSDEILNRLALVPALYSSAWLAAHHMAQPPWYALALPFVGYIFLHANFAHVLINSLWLLAFGSAVARRFGAPLFFAFFLICGIAGAVAHLASNWGSEDAAVGASGAIAGVMAAGMRMLALQLPLGAPEGTRRLLPLTAPPVLFFTTFWIVVNAAVGLTGFTAGPVSGPVAWQAHIWGYLVGLFLSGPFDRLAGQREIADNPAP